MIPVSWTSPSMENHHGFRNDKLITDCFGKRRLAMTNCILFTCGLAFADADGLVLGIPLAPRHTVISGLEVEICQIILQLGAIFQ